MSDRPLVDGATLNLASLVVGSVFMLLVNLLVARYLGASALGAYTLIVALLTIGGTVAMCGLDSGVLEAIPPLTEAGDQQSRVKPLVVLVFAWVAASGATLVLLLAVAADWVAALFELAALQGPLRFAFLALPFTALNLLGLAVLRALRWFGTELVLGGILYKGSRPLVLILLLWLANGAADASATLLAMILVVEAAFASLLFATLLRELPGRALGSLSATVPTLRRTLTFSLPLTPAMAVQVALQNADLIVLGAVAAAADLGVFRAASLVALTMTLVMRAFGASFAPRIAADYAAGRQHELASAYRGVALAIFSVTIPGFVVFIVNRAWLLGLFGAEFVPVGSAVLVILCVGQLVNASTGQVGYMLLLAGNRNSYIWTAFAAVIFMVAATFLGYQVGGLIGAAAGSAVANAAVNLLRAGLVHRLLGVHPFSWGQGMAAFIGFSAISVAALLQAWLDLTTATMLVGSGSLASLAGALLLRRFRDLPDISS